MVKIDSLLKPTVKNNLIIILIPLARILEVWYYGIKELWNLCLRKELSMKKFFISIMLCMIFLSATSGNSISNNRILNELTNKISTVVSAPIEACFDRIMDYIMSEFQLY
jgi:hypothetical protein